MVYIKNYANVFIFSMLNASEFEMCVNH